MIFEFAVSFGDRGLGTHSMERQAEILANLKRLWEGKDHIAEARKKVEQDDPDMKPEYNFSKGVRGVAISGKPKGTCQKCGGRKRVPTLGVPTLGMKGCPDCAGTGECQHKDVKHIGGCLYCPDCRQYLNDRRRGEERREGKERDYNLRSANPGESFYMDHDDRVGRDRRALPDRRKARPTHSARSGA